MTEGSTGMCGRGPPEVMSLRRASGPKEGKMEKELLTVRDASNELGVAPVTVAAHIRRRNLTAEQFGRVWLIRREHLEQFKAARRRPGRPKKNG